MLLVIVVMFAAGTAASHLLFCKSPMARAIARVGKPVSVANATYLLPN
jgi:hypothetical protein